MTSLRRIAGDGPTFPEKGRHFFKIILDSTVNLDGKLGIPGEFVRKYGEFLSNPVFLKVPNGAVWQVDLMKCDNDGEVWIQNGWPEFAKFYSIGYGHLLVFRYEGNSHFHVLIFDKSALEIEYPSNSEEPNLDRVVEMKKIEHDYDSVKNLDDFSKKRGKKPLQSLRPCKMTRTNPTSKIGNTSKQSLALHIQSKSIKDWVMRCAKSEREVGSHYSFKEYEAELGNEVMHPKHEQSEVLERMQLMSAHERAKAFKPKNPFFMVRMRPSYVAGRTLSVPISFASQYFAGNNNVILRVSDGRTWSAKGRLKEYGSGTISQLYCGWSVFAQDNNLKVGNVCVFELVEGSEITLEVVIFRDSKSANYKGIQSSGMNRAKSKRDIGSHCSPQEFGGGSAVMPIRGQQSKALGRTATERTRALQRAKAFKSKNPFFMINIRPSHITGHALPIPISFASRYFAEKPITVVLRANGRTWFVKGFSKAYNSGMISLLNCGWSAFAQDNNLKVGNVCVFELIKSTELILEVVIF